VGSDGMLVVVFDDRKVKLKEIVDALAKGSFPVKGDPEFLN
jgi:hypothetical protein